MHNTTVIHIPRRLDRAKYVGALHDLFPNLTLTVAQIPVWDSNPYTRAVRGAALSHLLAVRSFLTTTTPLVVFEDDAVAVAPSTVRDDVAEVLQRMPADAGVVLLGGDVRALGEPDENGFREVLPPWFAAHAVCYTPKLINTAWLLNAYALTAANQMGVTDGHTGLCYESVLLQALQGTGLKVYTAAKPLFTTAVTVSDRTGTALPPANAGQEVTTPAASN